MVNDCERRRAGHAGRLRERCRRVGVDGTRPAALTERDGAERDGARDGEGWDGARV